MILCLVTNRSRLGTAMGAPPSQWIDLLHRQVMAAVAAGVDFIQLREPDLEAGVLAAVVRDLMRGVAGTATRVLVNDRIDVALAAGASGVHLKEQSVAPDHVRLIAPAGFFISCAVHTAASAAARNAADLLIAGTVLPTASKHSVDYLNKTGLDGIVEAAAHRPVLGIGGMDVSSMPLLAATRAAGMAAVGAFVPRAKDDVSEFVQKRVRELRLAFDSAARRS
jgi:thiamine-phosphate pyrophosphorylase